MASYAILNNGVVENTVEWDGEGDLFAGLDIIEINEGVQCGIGWVYENGNFRNPGANPEPTNQEMYNSELKSMATVYNSDIMTLSDQYAKAALIDGVNEDTKKAAIYAEYQARKVRYQADLADLKVKYGV